MKRDHRPNPHWPRPSTPAWRALAIILTVALVSVGCVSSGRAGGGKAGAIERLEDRAKREASRRRSPLLVAVVPGIAPEILAPRPAEDLKARLPLGEALSRCAAFAPALRRNA